MLPVFSNQLKQTVSPQESFKCSLGVDPSVRVTYNPPSKKINAPTGSILTKSTVTTSHSQRITVKNTRVFPVDKLIIKDQIPISNDARIKVTVTQPALPDKATTTNANSVSVKEIAIPN